MTNPMDKQPDKPKVQLSGTNGNVFALLAKGIIVLNRNKQPEQAKELIKKVFAAASYDEALQLMMEYCDVS